jgi:hypothetical protein
MFTSERYGYLFILENCLKAKAAGENLRLLLVVVT